MIRSLALLTLFSLASTIVLADEAPPAQKHATLSAPPNYPRATMVPSIPPAPTISPAQAANAMKFLGRVQLQGVEAPAFMEVSQALAAMAQVRSPPPATPEVH